MMMILDLNLLVEDKDLKDSIVCFRTLVEWEQEENLRDFNKETHFKEFLAKADFQKDLALNFSEEEKKKYILNKLNLNLLSFNIVILI